MLLLSCYQVTIYYIYSNSYIWNQHFFKKNWLNYLVSKFHIVLAISLQMSTCDKKFLGFIHLFYYYLLSLYHLIIWFEYLYCYINISTKIKLQAKHWHNIRYLLSSQYSSIHNFFYNTFLQNQISTKNKYNCLMVACM